MDYKFNFPTLKISMLLFKYNALICFKLNILLNSQFSIQ